MTIRTWYYHGTSQKRWLSIRMHSAFAILPVYLTTDKQRAEHYAKARAAHDGDTEYEIIGIHLEPHRVEVDDYSDNEPGQYKLTKPLHQNTVYSSRLHVDTFPMPVDQDKLLTLKAFCVGMGWGEDRHMAPGFEYLAAQEEDNE